MHRSALRAPRCIASGAPGSDLSTINPIIFEVIRNRLIAITEEMRVALQSVSGSPTVTEASDFFTGLFTPVGAVASMGFQVAYHAPVSGAFIRHIGSKPSMTVADGDMFIGNDPYIAALHQNDVQMVAPIFAGTEIIAWAGVEAHETDVGGMDFASWSPKAKEIWQEGMRIPCVKLIDGGEMRDDVLEMIVTASRLPALLGLDIRAFIATLNVARDRVSELARRYGADVVTEAMGMVIASSEARMRARLKELPDGEFHAADFLEHDGHGNVLYTLDCRIEKRGDALTLDYSGSSRQSPGFINCTRPGLMGAVCGSVLPTFAFDMPWNQGALTPFEVVAPDGLICTAKFPAPVGSATVETVWVTANATMLALNKILAASPHYRHRAQGLHAGAMATFNLGGINQFGEPFGLHLMDPIAAGGAAWPGKDGVDGGGPITSPVSCIADVEKNEQVVPLFYFHRRLARDTGGPGKFRGGMSAEVSLTLGGIEQAHALVMTHGVEVPNGHGFAGGWPGATIRQTWGRNAAKDGRLTDGEWQVFPPKPGLMLMTNRDVFAVSWQGGGGYGDPLEREPEAVARDVAAGAVSPEAAEMVYGVCHNGLDRPATEARRTAIRLDRLGRPFTRDPEKMFPGAPTMALSESLFLAHDRHGWHVITRAGYILCTGSTRWRAGAVAKTWDKLPDTFMIRLHDDLAATTYYCPATGTLLAVDFHRRDEVPADDVVLDLDAVSRAQRSMK
ncbi:MAG: hydantoinase B/oxoprolinase family protein [Rhizobiales bacterium]|nr:hydantoinase B/oxoprolinase family protein [Hyphomicrobiales bacterium]